MSELECRPRPGRPESGDALLALMFVEDEGRGLGG